MRESHSACQKPCLSPPAEDGKEESRKWCDAWVNCRHPTPRPTFSWLDWRRGDAPEYYAFIWVDWNSDLKSFKIILLNLFLGLCRQLISLNYQLGNLDAPIFLLFTTLTWLIINMVMVGVFKLFLNSFAAEFIFLNDLMLKWEFTSLVLDGNYTNL